MSFYDPQKRTFIHKTKYYENRKMLQTGGVVHNALAVNSTSTTQTGNDDERMLVNEDSIQGELDHPSEDNERMLASENSSIHDGELDHPDDDVRMLISDDSIPEDLDESVLEETMVANNVNLEETGPFRLYDDEEEYDENEECREDAEDEEENETASIEKFHRELGSWLICSKTRQRNGKALLKLLRNADKHSVILSSLPKHPNTLYPKKRADVIFEEMQPGESAYIGVQQSLELSELFYNKEKSDINLVTHVDGLPLFQTSGIQFWPILGSCNRRPIFIISLYKGLKKPESCNVFIKRFIDEILPYFRNGIQVHDKKYSFHLTCILADAPARAFLLSMKFHSGYFSCSKCPIKGIYRDGRVCFPLLKENQNLPRRSPGLDFYKGTNDEGQECPLHRIPLEYFNIVDDVLLDSMHLIYIGVMKKLIETWMEGVTVKREGKTVRLCSRLISATNIKLVNDRLRQMNQYYPCEFQRSPRPVSELAYWRAHEYRQFVLYLGYGILHDILPEQHLSNFVTLQCYCRILADATKVGDKNMINYTVKLAELFIVTACELFGEHWAIYNVHGLLHIPEDVFKFGCLENASCFLFESFMYVLKQLVRSGRHPLKQAINRWLEWISVRECADEDDLKVVGLSHVYRDTFNTIGDEYNNFKQFHLQNFILRCDRKGDSCCFLNNNFIEIKFFACSKVTGKIFIVGQKYLSVKPLYDDPMDSPLIGVYQCKRLTEDIQIFPVSDENTVKKIYRFPLFGTDAFVCSILLHSLE